MKKEATPQGKEEAVNMEGNESSIKTVCGLSLI